MQKQVPALMNVLVLNLSWDKCCSTREHFSNTFLVQIRLMGALPSLSQGQKFTLGDQAFRRDSIYRLSLPFLLLLPLLTLQSGDKSLCALRKADREGLCDTIHGGSLHWDLWLGSNRDSFLPHADDVYSFQSEANSWGLMHQDLG